jgi:hypothetical protein
MTHKDFKNDNYVYGHKVDSGLLDHITGTDNADKVRYAANTHGSHGSFSVVEGPRDTSFAPVIEELFGGSPASVWTNYPVKIGPLQIRWTKQYAFSAFVLVWTDRGAKDRVLERISESTVPGYNGSAIVSGGFDILVEVGADTEDDLHEQVRLVDDIQEVRSIDPLRVTRFHYRDPHPHP